MSILEQLAEPFEPARVSWRVGATSGDKTKGLALAYIDARDVMARLDEVCGADGWQNDYPHANGKTVCRIGIRIKDEWIWKANGAGDTDVEAEKGALSDAFKRAAVMWGIGRYLYDVDSPWVQIEAMGRSFKIKDSEKPKLYALLGGKRADTPAEKPPTIIGEPQATTEANKLVENVNGCVSSEEMNKYLASDAFKSIYTTLPQKHRDRVHAAGKARREKIGAVAA